MRASLVAQAARESRRRRLFLTRFLLAAFPIQKVELVSCILQMLYHSLLCRGGYRLVCADIGIPEPRDGASTGQLFGPSRVRPRKVVLATAYAVSSSWFFFFGFFSSFFLPRFVLFAAAFPVPSNFPKFCALHHGGGPRLCCLEQRSQYRCVFSGLGPTDRIRRLSKGNGELVQSLSEATCDGATPVLVGFARSQTSSIHKHRLSRPVDGYLPK